MAEIQFGENSEQAMIVVKSFVQRINHDFYGNGRAGVMEEIRTFMDTFNATEKERERQHKSNTARLNLIIAILTVIALYIAIMISIKGLPKTSDVFHSQSTQLAQQSAKIPTTR